MGLGDIQLWDNTPKYFTWLLRACAAEFIGVALFVFLGVGAVTSTGKVAIPERLVFLFRFHPTAMSR